MTLEQKIDIIKENKESIIAGFNSYLDSIYDIVGRFLDANGNLKAGLEKNEKGEKFLADLKDSAKEYENVRQKLIKDDFNLTVTEVARCALPLGFVITTFEKRIEQFNSAKSKAEEIFKDLMSNLDESN